MKRATVLLLLLYTFCCHSFAQSRYVESKSTYYAGQLLIMLKSGCQPDHLITSIPYLHDARPVSREWNIWNVSFDPAGDAEAVKKQVAANPLVLIAQFNHKSIPLKTTPNDTLFSNQWDMTKISAPQAWDLVTGGLTSDTQQVVVAIIDQSFDLTHPDINWWKNTLEIPNNGIDDDSDGYVDDYNGWNVMFNNDSFPPLNHGTFVSGISGALGNNTMGVAGVCWNVKEMVVGTGNGDSEAEVVSAYSYVFKQRQLYNTTSGAKGAFVVVTNSSFGPAGYGYDYPLWNAMYDSMGHMGILSAGATSNTASCNTDTCPDIPSQCASDYTIIVTGTTSTDVRHGGYGPHNVDIAAPGNGSYTTLLGGLYGTCGGTSAASPHVAGAIALMWTAACPEMLEDYKDHPDSMALLMKQYLLESVDTLPALVGMIVSGGRLNVYKAIQKVKAYNCTPDTTTTTIAVPPAEDQPSVSIYPNPVSEHLTIQSAYPIRSVIVYNMLGQMVASYMSVSEIDVAKLVSGVYAIHILDSNGNRVVQNVVKE